MNDEVLQRQSFDGSGEVMRKLKYFGHVRRYPLLCMSAKSPQHRQESLIIDITAYDYQMPLN